ncbi:MAG: MaoC family dehydratase [Burkholderiales bacterium]|nr:MaoC family dehydratase [Burkholderiales bacterium]
MSAPAQPARAADVRAGDALPARRWTVTRDDIEAFGEFLYPATADNPQRKGNPHIDEEYARRSIYGALFVDGNHTVALLCRMAADWLPSGALAYGEYEVDFRFPNPVRVGDEIRFAGRVTGTAPREGRDRVTLEMIAHNQAGKVVAAGTITTVLPASS